MLEVSRLFIKGMVCNRCVLIVSKELNSLGYKPEEVTLGAVAFRGRESEIDRARIGAKLGQHGFQLLEGRKEKMAREVKELVEEVYNGEYDFPDGFRFSDLIRQRWGNYETVSDAFMTIAKITIERYMMEYRMNKVKEFLVYSNETLAHIAFRLNFNSVAHLSAQFKQHTGLTPSFFKEIRQRKTAVVFSNN